MCPCESKRRTLFSEKSDTERAGKCVRQMVVNLDESGLLATEVVLMNCYTVLRDVAGIVGAASCLITQLSLTVVMSSF